MEKIIRQPTAITRQKMIIECTGSSVINDHRMKLPAMAPVTDKKCRIFFLPV